MFAIETVGVHFKLYCVAYFVHWVGILIYTLGMYGEKRNSFGYFMSDL
mgnify:CR=1 FL=1